MCFHEIKNRRRRAFHINRRCPICHATVNADRAAPIRNGFIRCAAIPRISAARAGKTARRSSFIKSCLNPAATRAARSARSPCASPAPVIPMGRFSPCVRAAAPSLTSRSSSAGLSRLLCHRRAAQLSERILHDHHRPGHGQCRSADQLVRTDRRHHCQPQASLPPSVLRRLR